MRRVLPLLIVLCLGFAPAPVYREKPTTPTGLKALQGKWQLVYCRSGGEPQEFAVDTTITVNDRRMESVEGKSGMGFAITLDGGVRPAGIDRKIVTGGGEALDGFTFRGIYKIEGDTLTLCSSTAGKRPEDFIARDATLFVEVYRRVKP
jgi:uncharacterized protein (TIGR03067 family)